jgi:DNA gyrase/topoisomerase IV subunit B
MTKIDVTIDEKSGTITVLNDGKSIPVQVHR